MDIIIWIYIVHWFQVHDICLTFICAHVCVCAYAGVHVVDAHVHLCMCGIFYHVYVRQINMCIICVHNLFSCFCLQKLKLSWCANNLYSLYFMHDTWCKDWSFPESVQMNHIWFNNVVMYVCDSVFHARFCTSWQCEVYVSENAWQGQIGTHM